jgi:anti-sigma B factor antagonist
MRLSLTMESTLATPDLAEAILVPFARAAGYSEAQQEEIALAVRECTVNAVIHGNRCDPHKKVFVAAAVRNLKLVISIQDEGAGFDVACSPDPTRPENILSEAGRGLFLIKSLMDRVTIRRLASPGMKVTMTKDQSQTTFKEDEKMSLTVASRQVGAVTVLDLNGRLVLGEETARLRETVKGLVAKGQKQILLNVAGVSYIDSSGLGALVSGYTTVAGSQGKLKLLNLTKNAKDLLQITKLLTVFEVYDEEAAAVRSF